MSTVAPSQFVIARPTALDELQAKATPMEPPDSASSGHRQERLSISSPSPHSSERDESRKGSGGCQLPLRTNNSAKPITMDQPPTTPGPLKAPGEFQHAGIDQLTEDFYQTPDERLQLETDEEFGKMPDDQQGMVEGDQPLAIPESYPTPSLQKKETTRQMELHSLLQSLSNEDHRYIRMELNSRAVTKNLLLIPVELQAIIISYLDAQDILRIRRVSRAWYEAFTTEKFCDEMNHRFFPTEWMKYCLMLVESDEYNASKWFRRSTTRLIQRRIGKYHSTRIYYHTIAPPDKNHPSEPVYDNKHQYCNGRLAIYVEPEGDAISVKSLYKDSPTEVFMDENREEIGDWLLSDRYLLYCTTTSSTIFAINLASDHEEPPSKITLPNNHFRITSALGNRVAISTRREGFVVWHIGRSLKTLDTSETTRRYPNHTSLVCGLFFHPIEPGYSIVVQQFDPLPNSEREDAIRKHFIVVSYYSNFKLAKLKVGEGSNQKDKEQIYQFTLYSKTADERKVQIQSLHDGNIGISNIDNFILHPNHRPWLSTVYKPGEKRSGSFNIPYREPRLFIKFDIHRAEFEVQLFECPGLWMTTPSLRDSIFTTDPCDEQVFFWRDQALVPFYEAHQNGENWDGKLSNIGNAPPGIDAVLLTALDTEIPWTGMKCNIPWYYCEGSGQQPTNGYWMIPADRVDSVSHVAYKWIGEAHFAKEAAQIVERDRAWPFSYARKILGDDDFVVLTGAYGFVVWCFNERITLPHVDSLESKRAEYLKRWRKMPHPFQCDPDHLEEVEVEEGKSGGDEPEPEL